MRQIAFDTLKFAERLILSGVPEQQAKAQVEALVEVTQMNLDGLSTKHDLQETESRLQNDLRETEARLKLDITALQHDLRETEARLKLDITALQHYLRETEARLDAKIERVHDKLDAKIDHFHEKLVAEFNGKFKLLYWMFGVTMAGIGTLLAGMATLVLK